MKYKNTYEAFLGTGLVGYRGILYTSIDGLKYNDVNTVIMQLNKLSRGLEVFLNSTGLYRCISSLPVMHKQIERTIRVLSQTPVLSFNMKVKVEEFLYRLLSSFGILADFCSYMLSKGI